MERESIDFVDRTLALWNQEVLSMCGVLSRIIYEDEYDHISMAVGSSEIQAITLNDHHLKCSSHLMNAFHFKPSTRKLHLTI